MAGSKQYYGSQSILEDEPPINNYSPGKRFDVFYDPANPGNSTLTPGGDGFDSAAGMTVTVLMFIFIIWVWAIQRKRTKPLADIPNPHGLVSSHTHSRETQDKELKSGLLCPMCGSKEGYGQNECPSCRNKTFWEV